MTLADLNTAHGLLTTLADLRSRQTGVSTAATLQDVTNALIGTGLESQIIAQSRQNVSDFLAVAINNISAQLTALGVTGF